jgi:pimeloyl-ACP methyl ester carboxylesterase
MIFIAIAGTACIVPLEIEALQGSNPARRDYGAPPGAPYTAEQIQIPSSAGNILAGTLTLPIEAVRPIPAVVTITGSSPQDRDHNQPDEGDYRIFRQLADVLSRAGIAVLRMDDRGVGESTGEFASSTTLDRADDIRDGIAYVRQRREIDPDRIILVGLSEGGLIAPLIASTDSALAGIVLLGAPGSVGSEVLQAQGRYAIGQEPGVLLEQVEALLKAEYAAFLEGPGKEPWYRFFLTYDPLPTARKVGSVPVLILQGANDRHLPDGDAEKLANAFRGAGNSDVTVRILPEMNHLLLRDANGNPENYSSLTSFSVEPEVLGIIRDWISSHTGG